MIIRKGSLLTMTGDEPAAVEGDVRISDGRIVEIAPHVAHRGEGEDEIDASGCLVLPGFVQAHVHLCQTLFRNLADDLELLDWLQGRIWPLEAWLDEDAMRASARLGLFELIDGGTTSILDMASVRHTGAVFQAAEESGLRYVGGKCLMDFDDGGSAPDALIEDTGDGLAETRRLVERWHGAADGRIRYAVAPRFAVSCTDRMLQEASDFACMHGLVIHSHASENAGEIELVRRRTGRENVDYLSDMGVLGSQTVLAHGVHLSEPEIDLLFGSGTHVVHCPSSNLKLASGIAPVPELLDYGINVALGADGAPCNNRLSVFREMRLASLIHKPRLGPTAMPAARVLRMATVGGARALNLEDDVGTLEVGKKADVVVLDLRHPSTAAAGFPVSSIVYSAGTANVRDVIIDGQVVKRDFEVLTLDAGSVLADAETAWARVRRDFDWLGRKEEPSP